jgi:hypothetical protein
MIILSKLLFIILSTDISVRKVNAILEKNIPIKFTEIISILCSHGSDYPGRYILNYTIVIAACKSEVCSDIAVYNIHRGD